jgi:hypothetical protein
MKVTVQVTTPDQQEESTMSIAAACAMMRKAMQYVAGPGVNIEAQFIAGTLRLTNSEPVSVTHEGRTIKFCPH